MALELFKAVEEQYPFTEDFKKDWYWLYPKAVGANVFSRLAWLEAGWRHCAPENDVIRPVRFVDSQGRTRAMCVHLKIEVPRPWGKIHIWKTLDFNTQRMTPFLAESIEDMASAVVALYGWQGRRIDAFDLFKLDPLKGGLKKVALLLKEAGLDCELVRFNEQPRVVMDEDWRDFKRRRSYKTWKNLRRQRRRIDEEVAPIKHIRLRSPEDFKFADPVELNELIFEIFQDSWQAEATLEAGALTLKQVRDFYGELLQTASAEGWLDLNLLYAGDEAIAYDLNLFEGSRIYMLAGAFRKELDHFSPGSVLFHDWMIDSHARGDRILEFGGEYLGYKEKWSAERITAHHLRIHGRTLEVRLRRLKVALLSSWPARLLRAIKYKQWNKLPVHNSIFEHAKVHIFRMEPFKPSKLQVPGIELKRLGPEDLPAIAACRGLTDPSGAEMAGRFQEGTVALGAWLDDDLLGFCFGCLHNYVRVEQDDRLDMDLGPEAAYGYDTYVISQYRRAGVFHNLLAGVINILAGQGTTHIYSVITADNAASIRATEKLGGEIVETVSYTCLLGLTRYRSEADGKIKTAWARYMSPNTFISQAAR